jgi:hypothetical protein
MEKKSGIWAGLAIAFVVIVGLGIALLCYKGYELAEASARAETIIAVLNANGTALNDCFEVRTFRGIPKKTKFLPRRYVNKIHQIDPSHTPKRFQLAWLDYVQAWERISDQTPGMVLGETYVAMIGVYTHSSRLTDVAARPIEAADALEMARQKLERVALEYDVRIIHQTN